MDYAVEVSFTDLCRICANPSALSRRISFHGSDSSKLGLLDKIRKFLPILVEENDGYPDFACMTCISKVCIIDQLHQTCIEANERLQALKTQLDLEAKQSVSKSVAASSEAKFTALNNPNLMDIRADIDQEIKGSYEMMPDADENSRVTVILPKESQNPGPLAKRSLVLVKVPTESPKKDSSAVGVKEDQVQTELKKLVDSEISKATNNLITQKLTAAAEGLRRSSRPRVHNRFYDLDDKSDQELHPCIICDISFATLKKLHLHQRGHSHMSKADAKNLVCGTCRNAFDSPLELKTHLCEPDGCEFCEVVFVNEKEKEQHLLLHKGPYTCDFCSATFSDLSVLQNHILCHTTASSKKRLFQCKICGKLFKSRVGLQGHENNHTDSRLYPCYICHASFQDKDELLQHRSQHTKEEKEIQFGDRVKKSKPYPCEVCHKNLTSKAGLEVHMRMHRDEKPYECTDCGKHFRQEIKLRYHYRLHLGNLPYGCNICGKRFNTQRQLDTHNRVHTNERPYICEVCGLGFRSNGVLGRHKQTHSEEPLFSCTFCGKKFRTRHATTVHERTHTGDKRVICDLCGRSFAHKATLDKHRLRHDKQRVTCVECNISFASKKGLRRHIEKKHSVTVVRPMQLFEAVRSTTEYVTLTVPNEELIVEVVV